jgi:hypothetical protein
VDTLYIAPVGAAEGALHAHLSQALGTPVRALDLNDLLETQSGLSADMQARCLLAVGAALRQERATL